MKTCNGRVIEYFKPLGPEKKAYKNCFSINVSGPCQNMASVGCEQFYSITMFGNKHVLWVWCEITRGNYPPRDLKNKMQLFIPLLCQLLDWIDRPYELKFSCWPGCHKFRLMGARHHSLPRYCKSSFRENRNFLRVSKRYPSSRLNCVIIGRLGH